MPFLIPQETVMKVLDIKLAIPTVENAFRAHGLGEVQLPAKSYLTFENGDLRSMPAYIKTSEMDIAGIKVVNVHPENRKQNLPTVMATVLLVDPSTGANTAIMDGTYLTDVRTGAAGAVAAKYLSRENSRIVGMIGAGRQAYSQLQGLLIVRKITSVKVWSRTKESSEKFADAVRKEYGIDVSIAETPEDAVRNVDILVTTTPSRKPIVMLEWVSPGTHVNAIGADAEGKQECESALSKKAKLVIDEWMQASHSGEINVPLSEGEITQEDIYAELGAIVSGRKQGRENDWEITLFDSTGLAIQDISTAFVTLQALLTKGEKLEELNLF